MKSLAIFIAGAQRSGKTTLAKKLSACLTQRRICHPLVIDSDETRIGIFGDYPNSIDRNSDEMRQIRKWGYDAMFEIRIPDVLGAGGTAIATATYSHQQHYSRAKASAHRFGATFRFIVLESPSLEEADRRSRIDTSASDFINFLDDKIKIEEFRRVRKAMDELYRCRPEACRWIEQGTPEAMLDSALRYILC